MSHEDKHLERFLQNSTLYLDQLRHSRKARLLFALSPRLLYALIAWLMTLIA